MGNVQQLRGWMAYLSSTTVMLGCIVKLFVDLRILLPDLLMNVSTMLRGDMPHCPNLPFEGSALDE